MAEEYVNVEGIREGRGSSLCAEREREGWRGEEENVILL
jgi:hypothetical protein